ncbi:hypothetical protein ACFOED_06440 [Vulcaniibacterium thermophilum]|uniref:hypothetical protein n=1 Tax=Vulcaniibacterium thermophilum TaxID=1169913 RepID=UPI0011B4C1E4|nr:hypothetical protein [Vulcaniibacterium thermophilum]
MKRSRLSSFRLVLIALLLAALGAVSFVGGIYYAWLAVVPGCDVACASCYRALSRVFGYGSYVLMLLGLISVAIAWTRRRKKRISDEARLNENSQRGPGKAEGRTRVFRGSGKADEDVED